MRISTTVLLLSASLALGACGSSGPVSGGSAGGPPGGGGPPAGGGGSTGPSAALIAFPPAPSVTTSDTLRLRGAASDPDGIVALTVNGVAATTVDAFAHWEASIPLAEGANDLVIAAEDTTGDVTASAATARTVRRVPYVTGLPIALVPHPVAGRVYALDRDQAAIYDIELATATGHMVTGPNVGSGPELVRPVDMAYDTVGGRLLVVDGGPWSLVSVDPATGARQTFSGTGAGSGPPLSNPLSLAIDQAAGRVLVGCSISDSILSVSLLDGNRSVFSSAAVGSGPVLGEPGRMAIRAATGTLFVADNTSPANSLAAVDMATGNRSALSALTDPAQGPQVWATAGLLYDAVADRVLLTSGNEGRVVAANPTTGMRSLFTGNGVGAGPALGSPIAIAAGPLGTFLVLDGVVGGIVSVDAATGDRDLVYDVSIASGPRLRGPRGIALRDDGTKAYVADYLTGLYEVDLATGDRAPLPGTGPGLMGLRGLAYDRVGQRLFGICSAPGEEVVWRQDLATGVRTWVSGGALGSGPAFGYVGMLGYDPATDRVLAAQGAPEALMAVDPVTGARTVISDAVLGSGPAFANPRSACPGTVAGTAIVLDSWNFSLLSVELVTGNRTVLSGPGVGSGPDLALHFWSQFAVDEVAPRLVVFADRALTAVDAGTGDRTVVCDRYVGFGPQLSTAQCGLVCDPDRDVIWLSDGGTKAIVAVDGATGDRVIVSR